MVACARDAGLDVVAAVRHPHRYPSHDGVRVRSFDLRRPELMEEAVDGIDAVIHLAAIISENSTAPGSTEDQNVSGTRALVMAARRSGVRRMIFVSSQSAAPDATSRYGLSKWAIEQQLDGDGEVVIRPGMVTGGPPRGVYGLLLRSIMKFPILPAIRPRAPLYPVHVDDLCEAVLEIVRADDPVPRVVRVAPKEAMHFGDYLRLLGRERLGKRVRILPLPGWLMLGLSRLSEAIPFLPTLPRERVLGLMTLRPMEHDPRAATTSVGLRDVSTALACEGLRRKLITEGGVLTSYVFGGRLPGGVVRRYVRAVIQSDDRAPVDLPRAVRRWPSLLRAIEPLPRVRGGRLARRLVLATRIVEMTPAASRRFHNYRRRPFVVTATVLMWLLMTESMLLAVRVVAQRARARR